jgi:hypothetical protein
MDGLRGGNGFVRWSGIWFVFFGFDLQNGFLWEFGPQGFDALVFFDCAAVEALALGLIAQEQREGVVFPCQAAETIGKGIVTILGAGDFDIAVPDQVRSHGGDGSSVSVEGHVQADGEDAGPEAGNASHLLLGEGHGLDSE